MAKKSKSFVCGHCKEEFDVAGDLPEVPEGSDMVCSDCYDKLTTAARLFFGEK